MSGFWAIIVLVATGEIAWVAVLVSLRPNASSRSTAVFNGLAVLALGLLVESLAIVASACGPSALLGSFRAIQCDMKFSALDIFLLYGSATALTGGALYLIMPLAETLRRRKGA
ncbi:hypothetical protein R5H32_16360 [Defluviimonas sp. D31]|uniref:hypothetical protein n=1 Tax=Defluviimonas sp. D31 TaxID=3083253 RepID=UPI00296F6070|nr:hypothetical protein [Defluviimonas sp. D31]MDW4550935.1 hypothetical protein [Defluviimonas sp. D31]